MKSSSEDETTPSPAKFKKNGFPKIKLSQGVPKFKLPQISKKNSKRKLDCEICKESFSTWWEIRDHWISSGHKTKEQCRWCKTKTFALQSHLCKQHWNQAAMCPYCGQLFMFREDQERHILTHNGKLYSCFSCGRQRKNEEHLKTHVLNHFLNEKYGCDICEKRFMKKKNLERHLKQVHFICQYCGKACNDKVGFKTHIPTHDDLICVHCRKSFSQKNRLKYHYQLIHGHQDFYKCTVCLKRFSMKSRLVNHMKLKHKGKSNYSCRLCGAPFLYWQQYINHFEKVHSEPLVKKVFNCSSCNFTTDLKPKLQWHMEKTSGDGFSCKKCRMRFPCKGVFDKHMDKHAGEKVWLCDHCPRSYSSDNTLKNHMSRSHKEFLLSQQMQVYPCVEVQCDACYTNPRSLARHVRREHRNPTTAHNSHTAKRTQLVNHDKIYDSVAGSKTSMPNGGSQKGYHHMVEEFPDVVEVNVYSCDVCSEFWFSRPYLFRKHMEGHKESLKKEKCATCDQKLLSAEEAVRHYSEVHLNVDVEFLS